MSKRTGNNKKTKQKTIRIHKSCGGGAGKNTRHWKDDQSISYNCVKIIHRHRPLKLKVFSDIIVALVSDGKVIHSWLSTGRVKASCALFYENDRRFGGIVRMNIEPLWEQTCALLAKDMNYVSYSTWVDGNMIPTEIRDDTLVIAMNILHGIRYALIIQEIA